MLIEFVAEIHREKPRIWRRFRIDDKMTVQDLIDTLMVLFRMNGTATNILTYQPLDDEKKRALIPNEYKEYDFWGSLNTTKMPFVRKYPDYFSYLEKITPRNLEDPAPGATNTFASKALKATSKAPRYNYTMIALEALKFDVKDKLTFFYDQDSFWHIKLKVEKILDEEKPLAFPELIRGRGFGIMEWVPSEDMANYKFLVDDDSPLDIDDFNRNLKDVLSESVDYASAYMTFYTYDTEVKLSNLLMDDDSRDDLSLEDDMLYNDLFYSFYELTRSNEIPIGYKVDCLRKAGLLYPFDADIKSEIIRLNTNKRQVFALLEELLIHEHKIWVDNGRMKAGVIESRPYHRLRFNTALGYYDARIYNKAQKHFQSYLEGNPNDDAGARYVLMSIYIKTTQIEQAFALVEKFSDTLMHDSFLKLQYLFVCILADDYAKAKKILPSVQEDYPILYKYTQINLNRSKDSLLDSLLFNHFFLAKLAQDEESSPGPNWIEARSQEEFAEILTEISSVLFDNDYVWEYLGDLYQDIGYEEPLDEELELLF